MFRLRSSHLVAMATVFAVPIATFAAFAGPSQAPPDGNVPGVVWNRTTAGGATNQQTADFNLGGSGRLAGDIILTNTKALRVDNSGSATFNVGNWGAGQQPLTMMVWGDIQTNSFGVGVGLEGKITAPKFCIAADCITAWPTGGGGSGDITGVSAGTGISGGGMTGDVVMTFDQVYGDGRYVNAAGDTMTGFLTLNADPSLPMQAATKQYVDNSVSAAGGGDVTGVSAGTGILVTTPNGPVPSVAFDPAYGDGRYVNVTGDSMTGTLNVSTFNTDGINVSSTLGTGLRVSGNVSGITSVSQLGEGIFARSFANVGGSFLGVTAGVVGVGNSVGGSFQGPVGLTGVGNTANGTGVSGYATQLNGVGGRFIGGSVIGGNGVGVSSTGMTGGLFVSDQGNGKGIVGKALFSGGVGAEFTGELDGVRGFSSNPNGAGVYGQGLMGSAFQGGLLGIGVSSTGATAAIFHSPTTNGKGVMSRALNTSGVAGEFFGAITGISGDAISAGGHGVEGSADGVNGQGGNFSGTQYGVYGVGDTSGAYFINGVDANFRAYLGYNGYGGYFAAPAGSTAVYSAGNMTVTGNITASGNTLASCAWTAYAADGAQILCPAGAPLMTGVQRTGANMRAYCCDL
ncbi:MAG: hypothetical protein WC787_00115 [Patescibacteria group bacterium]|jgi:hypothetical protein